MLFYFTATGNSLYVARKLDKHILSIPQELKQEKQHYQDKKIGIISPVYAGELPQIVRKFIEKAQFDTDYFYIILTYGKNNSIASTWSQSFCKENGIHVDYINSILMVDNYLPSFNMEEEISLDKKIDKQINKVYNDIKVCTKFILQPTQDGIDLYTVASKRFSEHPELVNGEAIIMTNQCSGCTICQQVCPIGNIKIIDGRAKRLNKTCEFCLACVHQCPFKAIHLVTDKNPNARYRHPRISLKDIVQSNKQ